MAIDSTTLEEDQNSDSVPRRSKKPDPSGTKDVEPDSGDPKTTTTLFVSNLAESVDSAKLLECASSIGPVRDAFVVSDPAKSKSRGFGYVRFVLREDAETALKDGLGTFEGQPKVPLVTWAKPKLKPEERDQKRLRLTEPPARNRNRLVQDESDERLGEPELKKKRKNPLAQIKKDPFANRIVVLQGLPIPPTNEGNDASQTETNGEEENQGDSEVDLPQRTGTSSFIPTKSITSKALYKKAKKIRQTGIGGIPRTFSTRRIIYFCSFDLCRSDFRCNCSNQTSWTYLQSKFFDDRSQIPFRCYHSIGTRLWWPIDYQKFTV